VSLKILPVRVRAHLYLFWVGMALAGAGVVGFFLSFGRIASATQAIIDVHTDVPVIAYASIGAWVIGLVIMWYSRRTLDAAVADRRRQTREPLASAGLDTAAEAPDGRDA